MAAEIKCPVAGSFVITGEEQFFVNTTTNTVGTCIGFSCYQDAIVQGATSSCCNNINGYNGTWVPELPTCIPDPALEPRNVTISALNLSSTECWSIVGALAGLLLIALLLFLILLVCCCLRRRRKGRKYVEREVVVHDYQRDVPSIHETYMQQSAPPSYMSRNTQAKWPPSVISYPAYADPYMYASNEEPEYAYKDVYGSSQSSHKPSLWLTYADSLDSRRGTRNRAYDYVEAPAEARDGNKRLDERESYVRDYAKRW